MPAIYEPVWVPATHRGRYRHMAKRDAEVWEAFLALFSDRFDAFAYDVALGGVTIEGSELTAEEQAGWRYTTGLKIDAVGREGDRYWIIEVRPEATVSALGAALCYALVAARDEVFPGTLVPTVVCTSMQPDVFWVCGSLGVQVMQVPGS